MTFTTSIDPVLPWAEQMTGGHEKLPGAGMKGRWGPKSRDRRRLGPGGGRAGELYDMAVDPDELVNLPDDPAHLATRAELLGRLAEVSMSL